MNKYSLFKLFTIIMFCNIYADAETLRFDKVIVTASKIDESADSVSSSIDQIEDQQLLTLSSVAEAANDLSGVDSLGGPRSTSQTIAIRGLSDNRIVKVIDGARQNFLAGHRGDLFIMPEMLQSVEILKGPSSTIWGSGAIGGVVNLQTKSAADLLSAEQRFGSTAKLDYNSADNGRVFSGGLYGRSENNSDYLLYLSKLNSNDLYLGGRERLPYSGRDNFSALAKWQSQVADNSLLKLSYHGFFDNENVPANPADPISISNPLVDRKIKQNNWVLGYDYQSDNNSWWDWIANLYYNQTEIDEDRVTGTPRNDKTTIDTLGANWQNQSWIKEQRLIYGVDYYQDKSKGRRNQVTRPEFPDATSTVLAVYSQLKWQLSDNVELVPALRYDHFYNQPSDTNIADAQNSGKLSQAIALNWQVTQHFSAHVMYNEAFRAPDTSELYISGTHFPGNVFLPNPNLKPERAKNKEVSLRYNNQDWLITDSQWWLRATFFRNDVNNFIEQQINLPGGYTTFVNVGAARIQGLELDGSFEWYDYHLNAAFSRIRGDDNNSGQPLQNMPADRITLTLGKYLYQKSILLDVRLQHAFKQDRVPVSVAPVDSYTTADVYATWQPQVTTWQGLLLSFAVKNITDASYRRNMSSVINESGRSFYFSINYRI